MQIGLAATPISQYGLKSLSPMAARHMSSMAFYRALRQAKHRAFWQKLLGKNTRLQSLATAAHNGKRRPSKRTGIVNIPLAKIVGSEARTGDFDNQFRPLQVHDHDRWVGIGSARRQGIPLPPIEVIQVNDTYFVRDGHHRVSVFASMGQAEIEARVIYVIRK